MIKLLKQIAKRSADIIGESHITVKIVASLVVWSVALIPGYIYLLAFWITSPDTFWQNFALVLVWTFVLGWVQVILAIIAGVMTFAIVFSD